MDNQEDRAFASPSQKRMVGIRRSSGQSPYISLPSLTSDNCSDTSEYSSVLDHENYDREFTQGISHEGQEREMFIPEDMECEEAAAVNEATDKRAVSSQEKKEDVFDDYHRSGIELDERMRQTHRRQRRLKNKLAESQQKCSLMNKMSTLQKRKLFELQNENESVCAQRKALNDEVAADFTAAHEVFEQSIKAVSEKETFLNDIMFKLDSCLEKDTSEMSELLSKMTLCSENAHSKNLKYSSELSSEAQKIKSNAVSYHKMILEIDDQIQKKIQDLKRTKLESLRKEGLIREKEESLKKFVDEIDTYKNELEQMQLKVSEEKSKCAKLIEISEEKLAAFDEQQKANAIKLDKIQAESKEEEEKTRRFDRQLQAIIQQANEAARNIELITIQLGKNCEEMEKEQKKYEASKVCLEKVRIENEDLKKRWEEYERLKVEEEASLKEYQIMKESEVVKRDRYNKLLVEVDNAVLNTKSSDATLKKLVALKEKAMARDKQYAEGLRRSKMPTPASQKVSMLNKTLEDVLSNIEAEDKNNSMMLKDIENIKAEIEELQHKNQSMDDQIAKKTQEREMLEKEAQDLNDSLVEIKAKLDALAKPTAELEKMEGADINVDDVKNELDLVEEEFAKFQEFCQNVEKLKQIPSFQPHLQEIQNLEEQQSKLESFRENYLIKQKKQQDRYNNDISSLNVNCASQREISTKLLNQLIEQCQLHHKMIGDELKYYQAFLNVKEEKPVISTAIKGIQRRIQQPLSRMADYIRFNKSANRYSVDVQMKIYEEFSKVCHAVWSESVIEPDNILKIASCLFGRKPNIEHPSPETSIISSSNDMDLELQ